MLHDTIVPLTGRAVPAKHETARRRDATTSAREPRIGHAEQRTPVECTGQYPFGFFARYC